jgi:hypothetical protein
MKGRCLPLKLGKHMCRRRSHHNRRLQRGYGVEKVPLLRNSNAIGVYCQQCGAVVSVMGTIQHNKIESFLVESDFLFFRFIYFGDLNFR